MASPTPWAWVWVGSRSWWWTGYSGMLQSMGSQRVGHDWATELNWWAGAEGVTQLSCFWTLYKCSRIAHLFLGLASFGQYDTCDLHPYFCITISFAHSRFCRILCVTMSWFTFQITASITFVFQNYNTMPSWLFFLIRYLKFLFLNSYLSLS